MTFSSRFCRHHLLHLLKSSTCSGTLTFFRSDSLTKRWHCQRLSQVIMSTGARYLGLDFKDLNRSEPFQRLSAIQLFIYSVAAPNRVGGAYEESNSTAFRVFSASLWCLDPYPWMLNTFETTRRVFSRSVFVTGMAEVTASPPAVVKSPNTFDQVIASNRQTVLVNHFRPGVAHRRLTASRGEGMKYHREWTKPQSVTVEDWLAKEIVQPW